MEAVKTMIHDQDLPMHLWDEEARIAIYVQNRLSHSTLGFKTPEATHLNILGFPVYLHISKEMRTKLDPSRNKGIFLDTVKSPKPLGFHHIEISRDVKFDEEITVKKYRKRQYEEVH